MGLFFPLPRPLLLAWTAALPVRELVSLRQTCREGAVLVGSSKAWRDMHTKTTSVSPFEERASVSVCLAGVTIDHLWCQSDSNRVFVIACERNDTEQVLVSVPLVSPMWKPWSVGSQSEAIEGTCEEHSQVSALIPKQLMRRSLPTNLSLFNFGSACTSQ